MSIKCHVKDCKYKDGLFCSLYNIEIDEDGRCMDYEKIKEVKR